MNNETMLSTVRSYIVRATYRNSSAENQEEIRVLLTQTIQTARQPFISRFLCDIARTLGRPPLRDDGGGSFNVLKES